ncbi:MAG TPA: DUF1016 domain-containing protein [Deltaproteobacteria bacterium]|nr:DUF1016 domain-containing protein [Deltaproteobacteria bacterium]
MVKAVLPEVYPELLKGIKVRVRSAQYTALHAVNRELIGLYWDIGRMIVEQQNGDTWGKAVVERLAADLRDEFPGMQGFSAQNLWYMRQLYSEYCSKPNLQPLVGEISWSKNLIIMARCKDDLQREFYIKMTRKFGWSKNVLIHHIENQSYEKTLLGQTNFDKTLPDNIRSQAKLALKDEYTFDFLELGEEHSERELERALIGRIEHFLREMGGNFSFLGSQYRLLVSDKEYFIDLLLFHRRLQCLVAVELKISEFQPEYIGKMQFYLAVLDDMVRMPHENPSIGIILCKTKDRIIVEYALKNSGKPIGVGEYKIVSKLPKDLRGQLPTTEQIEVLLRDEW